MFSVDDRMAGLGPPLIDKCADGHAGARRYSLCRFVAFPVHGNRKAE